ncbi:hypothetical protein KJ909_02560, partial [Patescibacteria group bacterium]|nr:hypothetical protein [Patescibacteria group bacterium]
MAIHQLPTMKAAIYDPYLDTLGGGERYCLTVAEILLKAGWQVDLFWSGNKNLVKQAESRFSLQLTGLKLIEDIFNLRAQKIDLIENQNQLKNIIAQKIADPQNSTQKIKRWLKNYQQTKSYDLFFYLSDGSTPFLFAKKNILHVQVPFKFSLSPT